MSYGGTRCGPRLGQPHTHAGHTHCCAVRAYMVMMMWLMGMCTIYEGEWV